MDMSGDELLDSQPAVLVPNSLQSNSAVSPNTFSSQLVRRLRIRGTDNDEAEAADSNNNNTVKVLNTRLWLDGGKIQVCW